MPIYQAIWGLKIRAVPSCLPLILTLQFSGWIEGSEFPYCDSRAGDSRGLVGMVSVSSGPAPLPVLKLSIHREVRRE